MNARQEQMLLWHAHSFAAHPSTPAERDAYLAGVVNAITSIYIEDPDDHSDRRAEQILRPILFPVPQHA